MSEFAFPGDPLEIKASEWNQVRRQTKPNSTQAVPRAQFIPETYYAKAGGSGISARSGSTLGSGTVTLYYRGASNVLTTTGITVTCYNISGTAVDADAWLIISREYTSRDFVVVVESCEAAS